METGEFVAGKYVFVQVARQLIAFGRLKRRGIDPGAREDAGRRKTTNRLRAIETTSGICSGCCHAPSRKTTNRLRAIETALG